MKRLWAFLLQKLQDCCDHAPEHCAADILEGELFGKTEIVWCRKCGAYKCMWGERESEWRAPRPSWEYT